MQVDGTSEIIHVMIKGKRLKGVDEYNPLAPGDWVELDSDQLIIKRHHRDNALQRFNWKQNKPQTFCANIDMVFALLLQNHQNFMFVS